MATPRCMALSWPSAKSVFSVSRDGPAENETYEIIFLTVPTDAGAICIKRGALLILRLPKAKYFETFGTRSPLKSAIRSDCRFMYAKQQIASDRFLLLYKFFVTFDAFQNHRRI